MKLTRAHKRLIGDVDAETASRLVTAAADIALVLDRRGVIRDVSLDDEDLSREKFSEWVGKPWIDTVTVESRPKIEDLLKPRPVSQTGTWRQVNHPSPQGADLPIRYMTVPLGADGRMVAMGRNLRSLARLQQRLVEAQREAEREVAVLQNRETRYRALFTLSSEANLIIDSLTLKIVETNPAAAGLLENGSKRLVGRALVDCFAPSSTAMVLGLIGAARTTVKTEPVPVRLAQGDREIHLAISLFRQDGSPLLLARLFDRAGTRRADAASSGESILRTVVERMPDGFVVLDTRRRVLTCNAAFLHLVQLATDEQVRGEPADRWLGRADIDLDILMSNLREHGSVRGYSTVARGEFGLAQDILVSGVAVADGPVPCFGLTIRKAERPAPALAATGKSVTRSVEQLTALIGRTPLKDIVRETTDLIEKLCIEAALKLTNDNRASAAEVLGLSRQSLYIKLRRYGLGELDDAT